MINCFIRNSFNKIIFLLSLIIMLFFGNVMTVAANQIPLDINLYRQHETDIFPENTGIINYPEQSPNDELLKKPLRIQSDGTNEVAIQFNDNRLVEAICSSLGKPVGNISNEELLSLTSLDASDYDIGDLTGLEYAKNLVSLDLSGNRISNITSLRNLTQLRFLDLAQNQITELSALSNLTNLIIIELDDNQIIAINALSSLRQLQILGLGNNQISNISSLCNLTNLRYLNLSLNDIVDISPLSNLINLKGLYLWGNSITSITALARLVNLNDLYLDGNSISNISVLSNLTQLQILGLGHNQINDISCLSGLTSLKTLDLYNNAITDITALTNLTQLDELDLYDNQIVDISPLLVNSNNGGLSGGDWIDLRVNPLDYQAFLNVLTLQSKGIKVEIDALAAIPTTNIQPGKVPKGTQISLSCSTSGAKIYYTIDGTDPTTSSSLYSAPITLTSDTTIKAIAVKTDMLNSFIMTAVYTISNTPQNISDAVIDPDFPIIYMTSKTEKRLYATNYLTGEFKTIDFIEMPESLEIGKGEYANELYVALLSRQHDSGWWKEDQSGKIAVIDRRDFSLIDTIKIQIDPYDIVAGRDGCLYIPSGSGQWTNIHSYDRSTKQLIKSSGIRQMSPAKLHPTLDRIYTVTTDSSPADYHAYNISDGTFTDPVYPGGYDSPYHGDYPLNPYFAIDPAGNYIYNGSGVIFSTTLEKGNDMKYVGKLGDTFNAIVFEADSSRFYILKTGDNQISTYDSFSYEKLQSTPIEGQGHCLFKQGDNLIVLGKNQTNITYNIELIDLKEEPPVTDVTINVNPQSPQTAGSTISLTANSLGGKNPEYRFWVKEATDVWKIVQNWSVSTNCTWIPQISGDAKLRVEARSTGAIGTQIFKTISYTVTPGVLQSAWLMPTVVSDAIADPENPVIYMTNKDAKRLYALNYLNGDTAIISFAEMPESLEIGKGQYANELYVALLKQQHSSYWRDVDQSGKIAVIDRRYFSLKDIIEIQIDPYDIVAGRDGCLYIPSGSGQFTNIDSYDRSTKQRIGSSGIWQSSPAMLHPTLDRIYTITTNISPTDYHAYNISNGTFTDPLYPGGYDSPYHGDFPLSSYFAIDPAGNYLYNGSGVIFSTTQAKASDMKYVGKLDQAFNGITFDSGSSCFYILPLNINSVNVYDAGTNLQTETIPLNGQGKYIFKQGADLIVLFQNTNQANSMGLQVIHLNQSTRVAAPTANPASGSFAGSIEVALSTNTSGAEIYYTIDGSIPTTASTLYTGPIKVSEDTIIKAIAVKTDMKNSYIMTASFFKTQAAAPTATPSAGTVASGIQVVLTTTTTGADIYYTTDDSTPTIASTLYAGPITINTTTTIKAIAIKSGMKNSSVATASYTISITQAAAPIANPDSGAVTVGTQVILTTATMGASIYYTTDGNTPTTASSLYTAPITINEAKTIKAIAVKSGISNSSVMKVSYTIAPTISVNISDQNLLSAVRSALNKPSGDITNADMLKLTELWANSRNISNLDGLQYATSMQNLFLYNNQIIDISALSTLTNLRTLYLNNNMIVNVTALGSLSSNLQYLALYNNQITDITALGSLTNLKALELYNNQITDISALNRLINLGTLSLDNNKISNISSLVQNSGLVGSADYLNLKGNPLSAQAVADIKTLTNRGVSVYWDTTTATNPTGDTSGGTDECFIATAAFGSKLEPQVVLLRQFRDKFLLTNQSGKDFVNFYYHNSPPVAQYIKHNELLKCLVRLLLLPIIAGAYVLFHPVIGMGGTLLLVFMLLLWKKRAKALAHLHNDF